jgi:hypothetical protein
LSVRARQTRIITIFAAAATTVTGIVVIEVVGVRAMVLTMVAVVIAEEVHAAETVSQDSIHDLRSIMLPSPLGSDSEKASSPHRLASMPSCYGAGAIKTVGQRPTMVLLQYLELGWSGLPFQAASLVFPFISTALFPSLNF